MNPFLKWAVRERRDGFGYDLVVAKNPVGSLRVGTILGRVYPSGGPGTPWNWTWQKTDTWPFGAHVDGQAGTAQEAKQEVNEGAQKRIAHEQAASEHGDLPFYKRWTRRAPVLEALPSNKVHAPDTVRVVVVQRSDIGEVTLFDEGPGSEKRVPASLVQKIVSGPGISKEGGVRTYLYRAEGYEDRRRQWKPEGGRRLPTPQGSALVYRVSAYNEFVVVPVGATTDGPAYFTNDKDDAFETAMQMGREGAHEALSFVGERERKTYRLTEPNTIRKAISHGESFEVSLPAAMNRTISIATGGVHLTGVEAVALTAIVGVAVFGSLAAYAISKGYTVTRKTKSEMWTFVRPSESSRSERSERLPGGSAKSRLAAEARASIAKGGDPTLKRWGPQGSKLMTEDAYRAMQISGKQPGTLEHSRAMKLIGQERRDQERYRSESLPVRDTGSVKQTTDDGDTYEYTWKLQGSHPSTTWIDVYGHYTSAETGRTYDVAQGRDVPPHIVNVPGDVRAFAARVFFDHIKVQWEEEDEGRELEREEHQGESESLPTGHDFDPLTDEVVIQLIDEQGWKLSVGTIVFGVWTPREVLSDFVSVIDKLDDLRKREGALYYDVGGQVWVKNVDDPRVYQRVPGYRLVKGEHAERLPRKKQKGRGSDDDERGFKALKSRNRHWLWDVPAGKGFGTWVEAEVMPEAWLAMWVQAITPEGYWLQDGAAEGPFRLYRKSEVRPYVERTASTEGVTHYEGCGCNAPYVPSSDEVSEPLVERELIEYVDGVDPHTVGSGARARSPRRYRSVPQDAQADAQCGDCPCVCSRCSCPDCPCPTCAAYRGEDPAQGKGFAYLRAEQLPARVTSSERLTGSRVQSFLFHKDYFTAAQASAWAKKHKAKRTKVEPEKARSRAKYWHIRQYESDDVERRTFATIPLKKQDDVAVVQAHIAVPKWRAKMGPGRLKRGEGKAHEPRERSEALWSEGASWDTE